jgi:cyclopropane fatty-acyl-phospholipid synthase-like methyltransferase
LAVAQITQPASQGARFGDAQDREVIDSERAGARQPHRFNPAHAGRLDDPARFAYLPPAELVALLDLPDGASLVDFGTGTGTYAIEMARLRPDIHVLALDEQSGMLDLLREKIADAKLTTVEAIDPTRLASLAGTAERIFALNVLHELGSTALRQLRSLLRTDGRALVVDWNADVQRPHGPPREHVYSPAQATQRLEDSGLLVQGARLFSCHYALTCVPAGSPLRT